MLGHHRSLRHAASAILELVLSSCEAGALFCHRYVAAQRPPRALGLSFAPHKTKNPPHQNHQRTAKYFRELLRDHHHVTLPGSKLIPAFDSSLFFTNAGMVQFKSCFLGTEPPPHPRVATVRNAFVLAESTMTWTTSDTPRDTTLSSRASSFEF